VNGALAVTTVTFNAQTGDILNADIGLNQRSDTNPQGYSFDPLIPAPPSTVSAAPVLVHESGDVVGLAHSTLPSAIMRIRAGVGGAGALGVLDADDVAGLCATYPVGRAAACETTPHRGLACATGCQRTAGLGAPRRRSRPRSRCS